MAARVGGHPKSNSDGDANVCLDDAVTGTVNGDVLDYSLATTATQFSNVGSYPITVTLGANPNYTVTPTDNTLTVSAKAATVVADHKSKTYGDANLALKAAVTGAVNGGGKIKYMHSTPCPQFNNVGSYPKKVTLGANPNY